MSKDASTPGDLLSKMVRFVRNPTVNWTELDSIDSDRESQYSKQALKEMIERKRRNDFVRRREFDQLRKLRQREVLQGQQEEDPAGRPSFFQSSMTSPDERAVTLKKIDEIEAHMSQQWWKSKSASVVPTRSGEMQTQAPGPVAVSTISGTLHAPLEVKPSVAPLFADDSMVIAGFGGVAVPVSVDEADLLPRHAIPAAAPEPVAEPEEFVHDPDLEEAAIRFANGDHAGAEAGLLEVLAQRRHDAPEQQLEIWMALFDLYRATGQQDRFDVLAIEFAAPFGRSAPLWFSLPEQLGLASVTAPTAQAAAAAAAAQRDFSWAAPATLAVSSVAALQAALARAASPWALSWGRLTAIDEAAVPLLADQFTQWADRSGQFVFSGVSALNALLESKTASGDRSNSPEWWRLRMAALRFMGRPDEFELVALDYCVTYEVSPPSWSAPRCGYLDSEHAAESGAPAAGHDLLAREAADPKAVVASEGGRTAALSGYIDGDVTPLLESFLPLLRPGEPLVIACDRLIRIDFGATGSVLNWAAEQQTRGQVVQFHNLHRLVAIFFNVIGVNEHAWVIPRKG